MTIISAKYPMRLIQTPIATRSSGFQGQRKRRSMSSRAGLARQASRAVVFLGSPAPILGATFGRLGYFLDQGSVLKVIPGAEVRTPGRIRYRRRARIDLPLTLPL